MSKYILSIEDNPNDIQLVKRIFDRDIEGITIKHITSGKVAIESIRNKTLFEDFPVLVLLDIKLSGVNGLEVLKEFKEIEDYKRIPVIIFSSSVQYSDLQTAYELRVNSYIEKPKDYQKLKETVKLLTKYWVDLNKN